MPKYGDRLLSDLPQQFKGKKRIEALLEVIGNQMDQLKKFFDDLNADRSLAVAQGEQLDKIGEILVLSRPEAGRIFNKITPIDDDLYRRLLIYKTIINFGSATYSDIMNCIKTIQGDNGFIYKEDANVPATIILESKEPAVSENVQNMIKTPIPRGAGIGLRIRATDGAELGYIFGITSQVHIKKNAEMESVDFDKILITYVDELENVLTDENGNILLTEDSIDTTVTDEMIQEETT